MDSILYYPSAELRNPAWLKASLLIWDRIYRIVPSSYIPGDSLEVNMAKEHGIVRNITLEEEDIRAAGTQFLTFCNSLRSIPAALHVPRHGFGYLRPGRIDERLYPSFNRISKEFHNDGWIRISTTLAEGYMYYLSKVVAQRRALVRGTDDRQSWSLSPYYVEEANFDDTLRREDAEGYYSALMIDGLVPANIADIPVMDLIRFVKQRREERSAFRNALQEVIRALSHAENYFDQQTELNDALQEFEREKVNLQRSSTLWQQRVPSLIFSAGIPVSSRATQSLPDAGNPFDLHRIAPSLFIGAVAAYTDYARTRMLSRDRSFVSFLIETDRSFLPQVPAHSKYFMSLDEFING